MSPTWRAWLFKLVWEAKRRRVPVHPLADSTAAHSGWGWASCWEFSPGLPGGWQELNYQSHHLPPRSYQKAGVRNRIWTRTQAPQQWSLSFSNLDATTFPKGDLFFLHIPLLFKTIYIQHYCLSGFKTTTSLVCLLLFCFILDFLPILSFATGLVLCFVFLFYWLLWYTT